MIGRLFQSGRSYLGSSTAPGAAHCIFRVCGSPRSDVCIRGEIVSSLRELPRQRAKTKNNRCIVCVMNSRYVRMSIFGLRNIGKCGFVRAALPRNVAAISSTPDIANADQGTTLLLAGSALGDHQTPELNARRNQQCLVLERN